MSENQKSGASLGGGELAPALKESLRKYENLCSEMEKLAADAACLSELMAQGQGPETPVAERGMGLSGGQRQRVALARALLKGGEILLMDD